MLSSYKLYKIKYYKMRIHTEQTCGICTRTPLIECGSGCGIATGTGPEMYSKTITQ